MTIKNIFFLILAVALSLVAATYRWGDSAHSIGLIKADGGRARHPAFLRSGEDRYTLIATATVIPPYKGDARVVLEGEPEIEYDLFASGPVAGLKLRRLPRFKDGIFYGLRPRDRLALWVVMRPPVLDPVCGMPRAEDFVETSYHGKDYFFCSEACRTSFVERPADYEGHEHVTGEYTLAMYDHSDGTSLLRVPITFQGKGERADAAGHHH